jgi:hypothetical protein
VCWLLPSVIAVHCLHSGAICPFCSILNGKHSALEHAAFSPHFAPAQAGNVVSMAADPHVIVQSLYD